MLCKGVPLFINHGWGICSGGYNKACGRHPVQCELLSQRVMYEPDTYQQNTSRNNTH